jgi:hypothetical protein
MRLNHEAYKLGLEERKLTEANTQLQRDITDLRGRFSDLTARDAVQQTLEERNIAMVKKQTVVSDLSGRQPADTLSPREGTR